MPQQSKKISLVYFVISTLLLVGLVPLVLTGWTLSERSGRELRSVENRYQIQLVQEKARQIEMFGQRHSDLVRSLANAFALSSNASVFELPQTDEKLSATLRENPDVLALFVKPVHSESLALYRPSGIGRDEVDTLAGKILETGLKEDLFIDGPRFVGSENEPVISMASPVMVNGMNIASVIAIVSLRNISRSVVGMDAMKESELWASGLPIIYVIDQDGRTIFHPDPLLM
ncbi:MAG: cache domain-containing protein, partial [Blastocatellia bacterium]|nr:cache domain-containing protein [Blastocatellia bacterium]